MDRETDWHSDTETKAEREVLRGSDRESLLFPRI